MPSFKVELAGRRLAIRDGSARLDAVPSMDHPAFQYVLKEGFVSPPSFGPGGDLRIYSAAYSKPAGPASYEWFASADWRRGRIQIDRRGVLSDIHMEPYAGGRGKLGGAAIEVALDYSRGSASITVGERHSALGKWTANDLQLEADAGAGATLDPAFVVALFLWCARPPQFLVEAKRPFI